MADKYVNGRRAVMQAFDLLLSEDTTIEQLMTALKAQIQENPIGVFKNIIMPLLPRDFTEEEDKVAPVLTINLSPQSPPQQRAE